MFKKTFNLSKLLVFGLVLVACSCSSNDDTPAETTTEPGTEPPVSTTDDVDFWLTMADQSVLLEKQEDIIGFTTATNDYPSIQVDPTETYQSVDGFGFSLTGGSAQVINALNDAKKAALLEELFGNGNASIGINYLRISVGASDLNEAPFTYDEVPEGETDLDLSEFSLEKDQGVISLLQEILAINPEIKIMATPWTAPIWMKNNNSYIGGYLQPQYYQVYAEYWVKYLQGMQENGITIDALTPQNEPLHDGNNPSMYMSETDQISFIKNNLGPALETANLETKIVVYDHNCDNPNYPITVMQDAEANSFIDGSAFHLYAGDIRALSTVHNAFPEKNIYFTEQYTASTDDFAGALNWHLKNVIIGSMRNWSKNALQWNLANNENYGPHTEGGCTVCQGALTIANGESISRNVGYYIIGHASKFIPDGSLRIASNITDDLQNAAFLTPEGKKVLLVANDGNTATTFNIQIDDTYATTSLEAGAVGTYIWE